MARPEERAAPVAARRRRRRPRCEVVDMRRQGARSAAGPALARGAGGDAAAGRAGHRPAQPPGLRGYVHCDTCGHVLMCADCELSLTYHSRARRLLCHHCGRAYPQPAACPVVRRGAAHAGVAGHRAARPRAADAGARRAGVPPGLRRARAAARGSRPSWRPSRRRGPAVLVGTQMVAKGHDFPDVTLVIVADADTGLYVPDFRAAERTFQLLTQVAGRAGRAERPGRVLVQTWNPDVPCIRMALDRDEEALLPGGAGRQGAPRLSAVRRADPAGDVVAAIGRRAQAAARHLVERLARISRPRSCTGPAPLPRLRGRSRWHVLVAARDGERARTIVGQALAQLREPYRRRGVVASGRRRPAVFQLESRGSSEAGMARKRPISRAAPREQPARAAAHLRRSGAQAADQRGHRVRPACEKLAAADARGHAPRGGRGSGRAADRRAQSHHGVAGPRDEDERVRLRQPADRRALGGVHHRARGCLSVPGCTMEVARADEVVVEAQDLEGDPFEVRS